MQQGWVHLNRSVIDNWVHQDKPFCYFGAWVDLILMANHEARTMPAKGKLITINRGQLFTSLKSLSERWGWSKGKVERYLNMLENDTMVIKNRDANGTLLTLVNYDNYQGMRDANETQTERRRDSDGTQTGPNKNIKNDNNVKNDKNKEPLRYFPDNEQLEETFAEFRKMRKAIRKPMTDKAIDLMLRKLERMSVDPAVQVKILEQSIMNNWSDIYELKNKETQQSMAEKWGII